MLRESRGATWLKLCCRTFEYCCEPVQVVVAVVRLGAVHDVNHLFLAMHRVFLGQEARDANDIGYTNNQLPAISGDAGPLGRGWCHVGPDEVFEDVLGEDFLVVAVGEHR